MAMTVSATIAAVSATINRHSVHRDWVKWKVLVDWVVSVTAVKSAVAAIGMAESMPSAAVGKVVKPVAERDRKAAGRTAVMAMVSLRR